MNKNVAAIAACFSLVLAFPARAARHESSEYKFSFTLPDGFEAAELPTERALFAFTKPLADGVMVAGIERMGGTIGREKLEIPTDTKELDDLPGMKGARLSVEEMPWHSFSVSVLRTDTQMAGVDWLLLARRVKA